MDTSRDVDREGGIRAELDLYICHWKAIKGWFFLYYELYIHIYLHGSLVGIDFFLFSLRCHARFPTMASEPLANMLYNSFRYTAMMSMSYRDSGRLVFVLQV